MRHARCRRTRVAFSGTLQRLLEGSGWGVLRPTVDFVLLCAGVVIALGGVDATLHVSADAAPRCWRCRRW